MAVWILDASHGGNDPGIIGGSLGRKESDIVLEAVLEAKKHLERNGETVILTRDKDIDVPFNERVEVARKSNGKYFINFNMNSHIDKRDKGVQVYYIKETEENERLARLIKDEIFSGLRTEDKGFFKDLNGFYDEVEMVGAIVYGDYLSNEDVEKSFNSKRYGMLVAKACLALVDKVLLVSPISAPKKLQKRAFRVCVGYYNDLEKAMEVVKELNEKGVKNSYIIPYDGR